MLKTSIQHYFELTNKISENFIKLEMERAWK